MTGAGLALRGFFALAGPFVGDYAATWAAAWPRRPRPMLGRSVCSRCGAPITAADKVPLLSWLVKRGRRGCCGGRIPLVYPIGEAAGLASGLAAAFAPDPLVGVWAFAVGLTLTYVGLVDLRRFSIPLAGLAALGLEAAAAAAAEPTTAGQLARLATGGALALLLEALRRLVRPGGRSGVRAGLGAGDVLLAGLLGVLTNWRLAAPMLSIASLSPLAVQYFARKRGPVAFGFWLSVATGLLLLLVEILAFGE
ncbi:MAG TPA: prepilin peptidase [Caulobacteraceae bacterium]